MKHTIKVFITAVLLMMVSSVCMPAYAGTKTHTPSRPAIIETAPKEVTIRWKRGKTNKYILQWKNLDSGKVKTFIIRYPENGEYTFKKLKENTAYSFRVAEYTKKQKNARFSKTTETVTDMFVPEMPVLNDPVEKKKKTIFSWSPAKYAMSYQVVVKRDGNRIMKFTTDKTKFYLKNIAKNTEYKVMIRAIRNKNGGTTRSSYTKTYYKKTSENLYEKLLSAIRTGNPYETETSPSTVYTNEQAEAFANYGNNKQPFTSSNNYLLWCNRNTYRMMIFQKNNNGKWEILSSTACIIGQNNTPTRAGRYTLSRLREYQNYSSNYAKYLTSYEGENAIHSLLYPSQSDDLTTGYKASYGCIRVPLAIAKFIYDNCENSTLIIL